MLSEFKVVGNGGNEFEQGIAYGFCFVRIVFRITEVDDVSIFPPVGII